MSGVVQTGKTMQLQKKRDAARAKFEADKGEISKKVAGAKFDGTFVSQEASVAEKLSAHTVGLVTMDDFVKKRQELEENEAFEAAEAERQKALQPELRGATKRKKKKSKIKKSTLSFGDDEMVDDNDDDDDDDGGDDPSKKRARKFGKNPNVDSSFLPDREREERERLERERLKKQWIEDQRTLKEEIIEITYSYWDGSGHRRVIKMKKGNSIGEFLVAVQKQLADQYKEVRHVQASDLMYIKEDLIIPHHYTFYDFIVTKARGKSGPLFSFDVHDDVRLKLDSRVEKDESHAGKVCDRRWYEKNKSNFPASRWEVYDPEKKYDKYTIHGGEVNKK